MIFKYILGFVFYLVTFLSQAQDTTYARSVIKKLTSKEFLGRGYVNDGVNKAAKYLISEFKIIGLLPIGKS
jgi:hypothetical protein